MNRRRSQSGVTLMELLIVVLIISIVVLLVVIGMRYLSELDKERGRMDSDRQAEVLISEMTRELRMARNFVTVSSTTLSFNLLDISKGYDVNTNSTLFTSVGKITYEYKPVGNFLQKSVEFPSGVNYTKRYFENRLSTRTVGPDYMFKISPSSASVHIVLRMMPGYYKEPRAHYAEVTIRATQF